MKKRITFRKIGGLFAAIVVSFALAASASAASTVTRSFSTTTPLAGSALTISLDVSVASPDTSYVIDEVVPAGWAVASATNGGDSTSTPGHIIWTVLSGAATTTDQYTVTVPSAASGTNAFSGTFTFNAAPPGSISGPNSVNVQGVTPILTSIVVSASSSSVVVGDTLQFTATAFDQNVALMNPQPTFTWTSSATTTATINASGLATGVAAGGPVTITATSGAISGTSTLIVTPIPLVLTTISVTPNPASIIVGTTQQFTAVGRDQNGAALVTQPAFTWTSSNIATATISTTGLATGIVVGGPVTITATSGAISGTSTLSVTPIPVLTTINVTPANPTMATSTFRQFSAATLDQFGAPIAATVTWSSSNTSIGTINLTTGLVSAVGVGTTTITATSGSVSSSTLLTTVADKPILDAIAVTPATTSVAVGLTQQFTASPVDQFGSPFAATVAWSSSNPLVGTISSTTGLFTAIATGTATITASSSPATGTALATVFIDNITPSIPTGLTATAISTSQINLSWTPSTDNVGVAGYQIFRNGNPAPIATSAVTNFSDTGLAPATTYSYTIKAFDQSGNISNFSSSTSATTQAAPSDNSGNSGGGGGGGFPFYLFTNQQPSTNPTGNNTGGVQVLGAELLPDGILARGPNAKIYFITNQKKFRILNLMELQIFIGRRTVNVSQDSLDLYSEIVLTKQAKLQKNGDMLRDKDTRKIFLVVSGKLKYIPNLNELRKYGLRKIFNLDILTLMQYVRF